ncbi:MAG: histidine ammonia-lyase [Verrucomicrobia bacterium]|nr:histidine ammonia-lyase [Verrucomicrobiota bacterium]
MPALSLSGSGLTLGALRAWIASDAPLELDPAARQRVAASRAVVEKLQRGKRAIYGINTGFGILADTRIAPSQIEQLQENLILSHAVGVGHEAPEEIVRLMLALKINGLALGFSGVTLELVDRLLTFANRRMHPLVYDKGSLGASGDLAPLAHLTLPLLGRGQARWKGKVLSGAEALRKLKLEPLRLRSKEGLAMINGTQFMSSYGVHCLWRMENLLACADVIGAMSLEASRGSATPFDARIHAARPHRGQIQTAENFRTLLTQSQILPSHADCPKVQDPYSLRCIPQVHGAARDAARRVAEVIETEVNSATDNPLVFPEGEILSGGNFHGEPLALALDHLAVAAAELASISERRLYLLLAGDTVGEKKVPRLLIKEGGLNSGAMLLQYTAAALVSENKVLCHPASVDSIPSSLGQEDHVSMGAIAATKLRQVIENAETTLALELLGSAQALDFVHPLAAGTPIEAAHSALRRRVPFMDKDRLLREDIERAIQTVQSGELVAAAEKASAKLHKW